MLPEEDVSVHKFAQRYAVGVPPCEPLVNFMQHTLKMSGPHAAFDMPPPSKQRNKLCLAQAIFVQCILEAAWLDVVNFRNLRPLVANWQNFAYCMRTDIGSDWD